MSRIDVRSVISMESDSCKDSTRSGLRDRRYPIRYPFAAAAEILDLKSGTRVKGVTSDLSLAGCFVCTRRLVQIGKRVRLTLTRKEGNAMMLAVSRVVKPGTGMGFKFLDVDPNSNRTLLAWFESLREGR
jgi:hypothetical protein